MLSEECIGIMQANFPQVHCTHYDLLVLHGELYLKFLNLPFPASQNLYKIILEIFLGIYVSEEIPT